MTFDHYEVMTREDGSLHELGRGAMGITYKAFDTNLRIPVALKVINATFLHSDVARQRFIREARSAAKLRHRHVASVFHLGVEGDAYFYAMEFIDGETVDSLIKRHGPLKPIAALRIAAQVARALNAAQPHSLVHRDIKPANLMLVREDDELIVKVIDFGLAKSSHPTDGEEDSSACSMGGFVGTPHFASPEQLEEKEIDVRSDIYSLGVTLWYMLAGQAPFAGSMAQVMSQHLSKPPPFEKLNDLSPSVSALLTRMLQKDPKDRPQTPAELRREIEACIETVSANAPAPAEATEETGENFETVFEEISAPRPEETAFVVDAVVAGRFRIIQDLGETNTGHLYRAQQLRPDREVRLLVLGRELTDDKSTYTQIEHEVSRAASVTHPNLLQTYSLESLEGCSFIVSEWTDGFSLQELLRVRRELRATEVLALLPQAADGIDHATRAGLRRLDLALHQVFVAFATPAVSKDEVMRRPVESWPTFALKLNPLGITRELSASETWAGGQTIVGDVANAAPERGAASSSIRSLAAIVYELLGGTLTPFALHAAATHRYSPIATLSEEGNNVLRRALEPSAPFTTAYEFYSALSGVKGLEVERREARPGSAAPRTAAAASSASAAATSPVRTAPPVLRTAPVPARAPVTPEPPAPRPRKRIPVKFFGGVLTVIAIGVAILLFSRPPAEKKSAQQTVPATPKPTPEFVETIPSTPPVVVTPPPVTPPTTTPPTTSPPTTIPIPTPDAQAMMKAAVAKADALLANKDWAGALRAWLAIEKENADVGRIGLEVLLTAIRKEVHGDALLKLHDLLVQAARLDAVPAMALLGEALLKTDSIAALNWYSAAAERGDRDSLTQLGRLLARRGEYQKAFACFEAAAEQGDVFAKYLLGECYMDGKGVKPDEKRGVALLQEAADNGDSHAMDRLGVCYRKGTGVEPDVNKAFQLFSRARELGDASAIGNLGVLYMLGEGVPKDPLKAVALFSEGAEKGHAGCMSLYARCLEGGNGVPPNLLKAQTWFRKAAEGGDKYAIDWCRTHKVPFTPYRSTEARVTTAAQP